MSKPTPPLVCCNQELDHEPTGRRDTETIGGHEIDYYRCDKCGQRYELIRDPLDGDRLYPTDEIP